MVKLLINKYDMYVIVNINRGVTGIYSSSSTHDTFNIAITFAFASTINVTVIFNISYLWGICKNS